MSLSLLITLGAVIWLVSLAACVIASYAKRLWLSVILSLSALAIGYLGLTRFHISASKTINGHVQWSFNSRWFFVATLILATLTLAYSLWKHRKTIAVQ